jgi:heme/copper-type cytochrome/quinol oxidase subunit 1
MVYKIASIFFYVIGIIVMFIPMMTGRPDLKYTLIPAGFVVSIIGRLLMGWEKEKVSNKDILDDGEF